MKIIMFNTHDIFGGAAKATSRLFKGLSKNDLIEIDYYVKYKQSDYQKVFHYNSSFFRKTFNRLYTGINNRIIMIIKRINYSKPMYPFSTDIIPSFNSKIKNLKADIIHLNWICNGFIPIVAISKIKIPVVWTLHDSWAFTGGCHIPFECTRYMNNCGKCPQLNSKKSKDISYKLLNKKNKNFDNINLTIVTPSKWLASCARKSSLFKDKKIFVIPNGIDIDIFRPYNKKEAREVWKLPHDKKLILFGAMNSTGDYNKGFHFLLPALQSILNSGFARDIELVVFGANSSDLDSEIDFKINYIGALKDESSLALLYSAVDAFIAPSLSESFGQTAVESMACGTPVVAFGATGLLEIVNHKITGYLAKPYEPNGLAEGIKWILEDEERWNQLSNNARVTAVDKFNIDTVSTQYVDLYKKILEIKE